MKVLKPVFCSIAPQHPNTMGLGTEFGLQPNDQPIKGLAAIKWHGESIYLVCLTVRLMPDTRDLTTQIIQQFAQDQELP